MCNREAVCRMEDKELTVLGAQAFRLLLVDHQPSDLLQLVGQKSRDVLRL